MNRIGSLCTGYGGLDMAVERVLGGETVWYSEFDKHPSTLLAQRFPGIPNLGDLTKIDWAALPEIDILTGGYPCQPFSHAGKRLGEHDSRHLWPSIRQAIRVLRPTVTILENVAGHRSKGFSDVLRDCAEDGLDVQWVSVRASDAGAPHRRERLFFAVTDPYGTGLRQRVLVQPRRYESALETAADTHRWGRDCNLQRNSDSMQNSSDWDSRRDNFDGLHPAASDTAYHRCSRVGQPRDGRAGSPHNDRIAWGEYEPAVRRWERVLGRSAPDPSELNKNGRPRLTAAFDEWMMGLPEGWVTSIDIPYGAQIKLMGNGVVPQQAELAIRYLAGLT